MRNVEEFKVEGYLFGNKNDVKQAQEEVEAIKFLEQKLDFENVDSTLRIYDKALQERVFKTPVGFGFLRKVQHELLCRGIPEEEIKPIALYQVYSKIEEAKPLRVIKKKIKPDQTKVYLRTSVMVNIALVILVIGMFVLSLLGETPNIVNYRHRIQNEYAQWEQELLEWENQLKEREKLLETGK